MMEMMNKLIVSIFDHQEMIFHYSFDKSPEHLTLYKLMNDGCINSGCSPFSKVILKHFKAGGHDKNILLQQQ